MFDIHADEISFEHRTVARFISGIPATLRDEAEMWLAGTPPGFVSEDDHAKELKEREDESYAAGKADGIESAEPAAKRKYDEAIEAERAVAFKTGRRAAAEAVGKAEDVDRMDVLLAHIALVEAKLRSALVGIREEGKYKNRQLKAAEFKTVVRECYLELNQAKAAYRP